jgi:hypothetical protein
MDGSLAAFSEAERVAAVAAFDKRHGETERVFSLLAELSRPVLLAGEQSLYVETLVRTVRHEWGLGQRPASGTKAISAALMQMDWSPAMFDTAPSSAESGAADAYQRVRTLVELTRRQGARDREYSWCSKVLHWLTPLRIPVFDQYVRELIGIPESRDLPQQYLGVAQKVFVEAEATRVDDPALTASIEPRVPLRVIDKWLWWLGGGDAKTAYVNPDPWRIVRELLGFDPPV